MNMVVIQGWLEKEIAGEHGDLVNYWSQKD